MTTVEKSFDKQLTLAKLQIEIAAFEALKGPLTKLDHTNDATIAVYKRARAPDKPVELRPKAGDAVPDGYSKVCDGTVWTLGQKQDVVAVRED